MSSKFVHIDNRVRASLEYNDRRDRERNKKAWQEANKNIPKNAFGENVITDWDKHGTVAREETHVFRSTDID